MGRAGTPISPRFGGGECPFGDGFRGGFGSSGYYRSLPGGMNQTYNLSIFSRYARCKGEIFRAWEHGRRFVFSVGDAGVDPGYDDADLCVRVGSHLRLCGLERPRHTF